MTLVKTGARGDVDSDPGTDPSRRTDQGHHALPMSSSWQPLSGLEPGVMWTVTLVLTLAEEPTRDPMPYP